MRTLEKNKTTIWYCAVTGQTKEYDSDGLYTGNIIPQLSSPVKTKIHLYPATGIVSEQMFGKAANLDMIAVSMDDIFDKTTLIYLKEPVLNIADTYDYKIEMISKSLNSVNYGLKKRVQ